MSVPNDKMMELMRSQQPQGKTAPPEQETPTPSAMSDSSTGPMSSPMSTPEPKMGNREGALVNLSMAMDLIEQALPALGSESQEGQKALNAIRMLTGVIGHKKAKTNELQTNEILQMLQSLPQSGGATAEGMAMGAGGMPGAGGKPPAPPMSPPPPPMGGGQGSAPPPSPPQM
mgnify:CR=1 FL=1